MSGPPAPPRPLAIVLALVAAVLLGLGVWHFAPHQGDDGFIFLRYAERLASGQGLGFSDFGPPVEGFSSPLWLLLLAGPIALGVPSTAAAQLLSAVAVAALVAGVWVAVRALGGRPLHAAIAVLGLALLRPPLFWGFTGLETPLAAAALVWTAAALAANRGWAVGAGLLGVIRPEGPGLAVLALAIGCWRARRLPTLAELGLALGPAAAWMLVRLLVYGDVLPNTFYAKAAGAPVDQLLRGLSYAGIVSLAGVLLAVHLYLRARESDALPRAPIAVTALAAVQLGVVIVGGGDWMWFGRLLVPVLVVLLVLVVSAAATTTGLVRGLGLAALIGLVPYVTPPPTWLQALTLQPLPVTTFQEGGMTQAESAAGRWIAEHGAPGELIAVNHAGALPWAAPEQDILDMTGLLDHHIAREAEGGLHARYDVPYVLEQQPEWVVLHTRSPLGPGASIAEPDYWVGETALLEDPAFQAAYEPAGAAWSWEWVVGDTSYTVVYQRRDAAPAP